MRTTEEQQKILDSLRCERLSASTEGSMSDVWRIGDILYAWRYYVFKGGLPSMREDGVCTIKTAQSDAGNSSSGGNDKW